MRDYGKIPKFFSECRNCKSTHLTSIIDYLREHSYFYTNQKAIDSPKISFNELERHRWRRWWWWWRDKCNNILDRRNRSNGCWPLWNNRKPHCCLNLLVRYCIYQGFRSRLGKSSKITNFANSHHVWSKQKILSLLSH